MYRVDHALRTVAEMTDERAASARTPHALCVEDLSVTFRTFEGEARVVDRASLTVESGELVGVVGETGCGKSVLMRALLDMLPTATSRVEGSIALDGQDLRRLSPRERRARLLTYFSMVFQDPVGSLNPVFTIGDQLREVVGQAARRLGRRDGRAGLEARARALVGRVQLDDPERILRSYPFQLSGGMNQRVSIALALSTDPWLIVADEPTTALDVTVQAEILALFTRLVREEGRSVLLITHSLGVVRTIADRVLVMYAGVVVEEAPAEELFDRPQHPYTVGLLGCVPRLTGEALGPGIPGTLPSYTSAPSGCRFHPRCPRVMPVCVERRPPAFETAPGHRVACWLYDER